MNSTELLRLDAPYNYIYYGGIVGKHVATLITVIDKTGKDGKYLIETHSHPVVIYNGKTAEGVVWNNVEVTQCRTVCSEKDKRVTLREFNELLILGEHGTYETNTEDNSYSSQPIRPFDLRMGMDAAGITLVIPREILAPEVSGICKKLKVWLSFGAECDSYFAASRMDIVPGLKLKTSPLYFSAWQPATEKGLKELYKELSSQLYEWQSTLEEFHVEIEFDEDTASYSMGEEIAIEEENRVRERMKTQDIIKRLNKEARRELV